MVVGFVFFTLGVVGLMSGVALRAVWRSRRRGGRVPVKRGELAAAITLQIASALAVFIGASLFFLSLPHND